MSLDWEYTDKKRFALIKGDPMNDVFVWGCMLVDLPGITEENYKEWHLRYRLYDHLFGPFYYAPTDGTERVPLILTLEDVRKRIGLRTNVAYKPSAAFRIKVWKAYADKLAEEETKAAKNASPKMEVV